MSGEIKLGGERKQATIFFSDIRDFTALAESMGPDEVLGLLNEYMTEMVSIIYRHHGVVDKYVGDAIMALWGVPHAGVDDAQNAVRAALEMRKALKVFNQKRLSRNQKEIRIGIGIHTGEVVAGNMGSDQRLEYTVIGDNVNQAARIESANKDLHSDILISETTWALVKPSGIVAGPALSVQVKGKSSDLLVHKIIGFKRADGVLESELSENQKMTITGDISLDDPKPVVVPSLIASGPDIHAASLRSAALQDDVLPPRRDLKNVPGLSSALLTPVAPGVEVKASAPGQPLQSAPVLRDIWYLVRDAMSKVHDGPYSLLQLRAIASQEGFSYDQAYVFREGDTQMSPLSQIPGLSRRVLPEDRTAQTAAPVPEATAPDGGEDEWYIYGDESTTYGPYSIEQISQTLDAGHITRTTYCWKQGLERWIYVYQIPGLDRRAESGTA